MLDAINRRFNQAKTDRNNDRFILEAVLDVEEVLPGSEEEIEDQIDVDSVPDDIYKKVDKALDAIVDREDFDDEEIEEMVDEDFDEDEVEDSEIEALIDEAASSWY